jgi:hypothetical protein
MTFSSTSAEPIGHGGLIEVCVVDQEHVPRGDGDLHVGRDRPAESPPGL